MVIPLTALYERKNLPSVIAEALEAHELFCKVWAAEGFTPTPEAHMRSFIGFAFDKGGFDALHWLEEHRFINDDQIIDWEISTEAGA